MNHPILVFLLTFVALWMASKAGAVIRARQGGISEGEREDFGIILASSLTLLGLIIGFTFSMAISRYDQRKYYEEEEANAIGTEFVRADLLPTASRERVRELLRSYLEQRVLFYVARSDADLQGINARTSQLQAELWDTVKEPALKDQNALEGLTISGMNDVLNAQGYTQSAWWNRIPLAAWGLMSVIAICCNLLIGYYVRPAKQHWIRLMVMPLIVSVSFYLIADIDSPRRGIIRVIPQNLISLQAGMR
jgi:hypothetical protein